CGRTSPPQALFPCRFPPTTAGSPLRWLRPGRHAEAQHRAQRPDVIRQSSGHGGRSRLPALGRARPVRGLRLEQRLTSARVRQHDIVIDLIQPQLLASPRFMFTQGVDSTPPGGHMLTDAEVDAFDAGRVDLPTRCCEPLLNRLQGAEHDAMTDPHQTPPAYGLDHLCIEQPGSRHPAWFWGWTL